MSLLTGLVVGWHPPLLMGGTSPAAASTPTITPSAATQPDSTLTSEVNVAPSPLPAEDADAVEFDIAEAVAEVAGPDAIPVTFVPESERRTITIAGVGDILLHKEINAQAVQDGGGTPDFLPQLEGIRPLVEAADLAICHMEYPLGSRDGPWQAWPDLPDGPPHIADAVAAIGFDACTTASNHTLDQGFEGVVSTLDALESAGLAHAGSAASESDAKRITLIDVQGIPVALLSYTYGFNGIPRPYDWCCNLIEPGVITMDAQRAREAGARLVVVALHHGTEGIAPPTQSQREVVQELADSGLVDLVLGHHAHVVQPVTRVGDMWVAYGHGNLLSAQSRRDPRTGDGLLTEFTFAEQADGTFTAIDAVGYAIVNYDFPFSVAPVPAGAEPGGKADTTWSRVSEQVVIPGDKGGFRLVRFSG
jgi:poly-gamma-glutamate capsule biosynthesis protein CapA/YwtB (metallophosphatase superfamily)